MTTTAFAGGLYFNDRGARPMARAGAFVAGADDAGAVWYNPAGLTETRNGLFADGTLGIFHGTFQRTDDGGNERKEITAENQKLPIPTFALTHDLGTRRAMFAFGALAPNVVLLEMPQEVSVDGQRAPAPQRYSLLSMRGSIVANFFAAGAVKLPKGFSIGATGMLIAGQLKLNTILTACDGFVCTFPEDPEFDANATVRLPVITGAAVAGITWEWNLLRIGASVMTPFALKGDADLTTVLPPHPIFDDASVEGSTASMELDFPWIVRAGVQLQPWDLLKFEFAFVWEQWSRQQVINIDPQDVTIRDVTGVGDYEVGDINIERRMQDVYSFRLGGELEIGRSGVSLMGGIAYENSAFKDEYLSPITFDGDKITIGGGLSIQMGRSIRTDLSLTHTFVPPITVTGSEIEQPQAIRPDPAEPNIIANGKYTMRHTMLGIGSTFLF